MNDQTAKKDAGKEVWKPATGYEGLYEVSNYGHLRSVKHGIKPRKSHKARNGYAVVSLCKNGKYRTVSVHRLVAMSFVDNPNDLPCVNHIDENKEHNSAENLEWCTIQYNNNYGTARERASQKRYKPCIGEWPDGTTKQYNSCTIQARKRVYRREIFGALVMDYGKGQGVLSGIMYNQEAKADAGKARLTLVPRKIIWAIAKVREYGCKKYPNGGTDNWKKVEPERYRDAMMRHMMRYLDDPDGVDDESGLPHLWHMVTNAAFLCEMEDKKDEHDT